MFLHSGASLHGHEYSTRPSTNLQSPAHLRGPLLRSAFSPQKQRARLASDGTPAPVLRQRPASDYIPRDPSPAVRFREPHDDDLPPTPSTHDESISDSEHSDVTLSIDGAVLARPARPRRPRRVHRKGTTYYLGYPAPRIIGKTKVVQKVLLPRLLLQLQQVSTEGRCRPVLEVFPASRIAGPVVAPRLAKRFPGIFGVKRHLGYDDIVLVKRDDEDLGPDGVESEHEESLERRNLLAVYSPLKHSAEAEIVLDDGSVWVAKPLTNGSYDFVHTDAEGNSTTARWARRHNFSATTSSLFSDTSTSSNASAHTRYTFSIINPLTRRHPVMATLTPSTLDVQNTYASVSPSHARHPPVTRVGRSQSVTSPTLVRTAPYSPSKLSSSGSTSDGENDSAICIPASPDQDPTQRTVHEIDDATKLLISVTALWVCLRAGWSQSYDAASSTASETASCSSPPPCQRNRSRRNTWNTRSSTSDTPRPPLEMPSPGGESVRSLGGVGSGSGGGILNLKRYSMPAHPPECGSSSVTNNRSATATPVVSRTPTPTSMVSTVVDGRAPPRRATSTGAAFMQRRLQASSLVPAAATATVTTAAAVGDADRDVVVSESDTKRHAPGLGVPAGLGRTGKVEAVQAKKPRPVSEVPRGSAKPGLSVKKGKLEDGSGGAKKSGMRSKLSRWIHRLGSSSR